MMMICGKRGNDNEQQYDNMAIIKQYLSYGNIYIYLMLNIIYIARC